MKTGENIGRSWERAGDLLIFRSALIPGGCPSAFPLRSCFHRGTGRGAVAGADRLSAGGVCAGAIRGAVVVAGIYAGDYGGS